ncbi:MAG: hypothetical protein KKH60_10950 [Proteobacteria bacterium]|nr:hypothetical protein [Pseudomonadota bacterium]MBU1139577.1 hypothetical protein [Pseudomonadota bacterium]
MDFKMHLETAWQNTLQFIVPVILLTLVQMVVTIFSLGILLPVTTAGYMQSLLHALRDGREPKIGDLFSQMNLFLPLFVYGLLAMLAVSLGFVLLIIPGFLVAGFIVFASIYVVPLMTDKKMGLIEALKGSWEMATREPLADQIILMVLYLVLLSVGGSIAVAVLFTQPLATFLVLSVYEERLQGQQVVIEEEATPPPPPPHPTDKEA